MNKIRMFNKSIVTILIGLVVLLGCDNSPAENRRELKHQIERYPELYVYKPKTGFCYSYERYSTYGIGKTREICTPEILVLAGVNRGKATLDQWGRVISFEN